MKYKSGIAYSIVAPIVLIFAAVYGVMLYNQVWFMAILLLPVIFFIVHMFANTYYKIEERHLIIRCGLLYKATIPIDSIRQVKETNNPISSPAISLDRLEIIYNRRDSVIISPKHKKSFVQHLTSINEEIQFIPKMAASRGFNGGRFNGKTFRSHL